MSTPSPHTPSHPLTRGDPRLRAAGRVIAALEAVSPDSAAALADAVFCRTTRRKPRPDEAAFLSEATTEVMSIHGQRIMTYRWSGSGRAAAGRVMLMHGWGSHAGRFEPMARALRDLGCELIALDAPGHGASSGWRASMPEFAATMREVASRVGPLDAVIGHSLGGAAAIFAAGRGMVVDRIVTIATPAAIGVWLDMVRDALLLSPRIDHLLRVRMMHRLHVTEEEIDLTRLAPTLRQSGLIIHDECDPDVPITEAEALATAWHRATLVRTSGLGHRAILRDPAVIQAAVTFARSAQNGL